MSEPPSLDVLRAEIDRLDTLMHDTLMARAEVVAQVAQAKRADSGTLGTALRPDREAAMARRLGERHRGSFPEASLQRIWREIIGALTQVQVPFAVHLGAEDGALRDAARFAFGNAAELVAHENASTALAAAGHRESDIAVLPLRAGPWWRAMPERAGVLMRVGDALVVGPRMDLDWDVPVTLVSGEAQGLDQLTDRQDGDRLVAGDTAPLDPACVIRPLGGYMRGPWVSPAL